MSATTIFFSGRVISVPGAYSVVDASGLEQIGLGASGVVAVIGTAEGGMPVSAMTEIADLTRITKPAAGNSTFRSGNIREAIPFVFAPAKDPDIQAGAQEIVALKTNPATQSTATIANAQGNVATLTSVDYGAFTSQINVSIATGTNQGKAVTILFEDTTEAGDDIGGDAMFSLKYTTSTGGWDTMTAQIHNTGIVSCRATRAETGLDGDITGLLANGAVRVVSASAADVGQQITVYGLDATGVAVSETLVLNGTVAVNGAQVFAAGDVFGAKITGTTAGNVTVSDQVIPTTIMTIVAGVNASKGMELGSSMYASTSPISAVGSGATGASVILVGKSATGATQIHKVVLNSTNSALGSTVAIAAVLTWNGTTTITTADTSEVAVGDWIKLDSDDQWFKITALATNVSITIENPLLLTIPSGATARSVTKNVANFTEITGIVTGDVAAGVTVTYAAEAARTIPTTQTTLAKVSDFFGARYVAGVGGFTFTMVTGTTTLAVGNLDVTTSAVSCLDPADPSFYADLYWVIDWINQNSVLTSAAVVAGASGGAPSNTTSPVFLAGGIEGVSTSAHYQTALNWLKQTRVNSIVVLTPDPAIHAMLDAHCAYMGGIGRSERDGFVGIMNTAMTGLATKAEVKAQIVDLNTRHIRAWAQTFERFNTSGERATFNPQFGAAILAGMQAGSSVGTSLTAKFMNILSFQQHSGWNPTDDAEEMIQAGLVFCENVEGVGRKVVRNVTTHLSTSNLAYTEGSVNEAVNYSVYNFRTTLEYAVGRNGFAGTVNATKGKAIGILGLLVDSQAITGHRSLDVELAADTLEVSVEMAPVIPINFVPTTVHLVTTAQAAAA